MSHEWSIRVWKAKIGDNTLKLLLLQFADHADEYGFCWLGAKHISEENECDIRHAPRLVDRAAHAGLILVEPGGGRANTNGYWILVGRTEDELSRLRHYVAQRVASRQEKSGNGRLNTDISPKNVRINTDIFGQNTDISDPKTLTLYDDSLTFSGLNTDTAVSGEPLTNKKKPEEGTDEPDASVSFYDIWVKALSELELTLTQPTFETWLKPTKAVVLEGDTLILQGPNAYAKDWLENKLAGDIRRALARVNGRRMDFRVVNGNGHKP